MATIALRTPTVVPGLEMVQGGACYLVLSEPQITVRELIGEKVRAELRKARAAGDHVCSLRLLIPDLTEIKHGPLDEQLMVVQAMRAFRNGDFLLLIDGHPVEDLDQVIALSRRTTIAFVAQAVDIMYTVHTAKEVS